MAAVASPPTPEDEDLLARQAEAFDRRAERLRAEARDLSNQAIELRLEIERRNRAPVRILSQRSRIGGARVGPARDARLMARITATLDEIGPCSSTVLANHLSESKPRVLHALTTLETSRAVKRSGIRRGTVWGLADDSDLEGHAPHLSARTLVLQAGQKLGTFDTEGIDAELPMLTRSAILRELRHLTEEGIFSSVKDGRSKIYAFERPEGGPTNRPKQAPPEAKVVAFQKRGAPIQGTGKAAKPTDKDVADLFDQIKAAGGDCIRLDNGHWQVRLRDQVIGSMAGTPSDWRGIRNTRAALRKAGLPI